MKELANIIRRFGDIDILAASIEAMEYVDLVDDLKEELEAELEVMGEYCD
ncbi:MAG: hypothetical protein NC089_02840 [Bacteroides sp.]|nr:hypothetical protein [Bacteroides sp.]MCM1550541.1 hypothetical protein [Clostridium sp.]